MDEKTREALQERARSEAKVEKVLSDRCWARTELRSCGLCDLALHWSERMDPATCNKCWQEGGPGQATDTREEFVRLTLERVYREVHLQPRRVLIPLSVYHPEMASQAHAYLTRRQRWEKVRGSWDQAESFLKSMASVCVRDGVDPSVKRERLKSCRSCPFYTRSTKEEGATYCGACGCGDKALARIERPGQGWSKLDFPNLECPLGRKGFSNESSMGSRTETEETLQEG